ncbi:MAG: hypothetical protein AAF430_16375 [Myxococcota bacterium]
MALWVWVTGCALAGPLGPPLAYPPGALRVALAERTSPEDAAEIGVAFEVPGDAVARARWEVARAAPGTERIRALVGLLTKPEPEGFGLRYRWSSTTSASEALARGEGNCLSLASVLVGLARGLEWKAFYGEAGDPRPEETLSESLVVQADHMVVVVEAEGARMIVDFLGPIEGRPVQIIDDLAATAHFVNNRALEQVLAAQASGQDVPWDEVLARFSLATRIDPRSARAWNNVGLALARLGREPEARKAYLRARLLDERLGSPLRNLAVLETRSAAGAQPSVVPLPR